MSGAICGVIVGAHPLVSTPASAKATAGKPYLSTFGLHVIHNFPTEDWLGILRLNRHSPNSPDFHSLITKGGTENQSFALTTELIRHIII